MADKKTSGHYADALERIVVKHYPWLWVTWCECGAPFAASWWEPRLDPCDKCGRKPKTKLIGDREEYEQRGSRSSKGA